MPFNAYIKNGHAKLDTSNIVQVLEISTLYGKIDKTADCNF